MLKVMPKVLCVTQERITNCLVRYCIICLYNTAIYVDVEGNVLAKPKGVMELEYDSQLLGTENHIEGCNNVEGEPDDILDTGILLLAECDVPGSSLDGKHPSELNVMQLKRWLVCRGAPTNGKKPELIERYVHQYMYFKSIVKISEFVISLNMDGTYI